MTKGTQCLGRLNPVHSVSWLPVEFFKKAKDIELVALTLKHIYKEEHALSQAK